MQLTENAKYILEYRYLMTKENGKLETPEELFERVAHHIARAELKYNPDKENARNYQNQFYNMMSNLDALPNTPCLINAGRKLGQLSACFVLDIEDDLENIFEVAKQTAIIFKTGGGVGINFSKLRPKGAKIKKTNGESSGVVSFMKIFDEVAEQVKQGGVRRGAFMALLDCNHPEIKDFIVCKDKEGIFSNFNISVAITDQFIESVDRNKDIVFMHPEFGAKSIPAKEIWSTIIDQAWKNGEPGIIFMDRVNETNPLVKIGTINATNPCGELPLLPFESCNLGSINLTKFVIGKDCKKEIDWKRLESTIQLMTRFLDNTIDMNIFPLQKIHDMTHANRKIGLGIMGWADLLLMLEISYSSKNAFRLAEKLMSFIRATAFEASKELAAQRGAFPNFQNSSYYGMSKQGKLFTVRNACITAIAPTGSLSAIAGVSSGIEPNFHWEYETRRVSTVLKEKHWIAKKFLDEGKKLPEYFITAQEISPEAHVKMQAAFQKYVDSGISKTVNLSNNATKADIEKIYILAHDLGCKGITVYRDGSRKYEMISKNLKQNERIVIHPKPRPKRLFGESVEIQSGCGTLYVAVNKDADGYPVEVFSNATGAGGCPAQFEAIGKLVSIALRSGIDIHDIVKRLKEVKCPTAIKNSKECTSCPNGISKILSEYCTNISDDTLRCPTCNTRLNTAEGCISCPSCGFTKCNG